MKLNNIIWLSSFIICMQVGCGGCSRSSRDYSPHGLVANSLHKQRKFSSKKQDRYSDREKLRRWKRGFVLVTKVIDGDTFWIDDGKQDVKVRFIGIDAPEIRNSAHKRKGYFGEEAKEYVKQLTENKWVRLELDVRKFDQYQRLLAYIYLEDGTFLNAHLIAQGYALVETYPPNVKYVDHFVDSQKMARDHHLGLWAK